ncbi:FAD-linked oxidase C-terminal domain-containing protein [Paracoccus sp. S1E-3]|uniref:FAD-binding oxidoreductase n=1 Tax=Paracoccus sp. S1E-3 TaxID=2756130 RepID=UPI0015EE4A4D|nr:FAD-linked oxidase C-terminal domain-containing protein [Paracoccus sp. S1E-3]MBA4491474.1 FAD-binding protein [Paracoccus sp. S1E-3]
MRPDELAHFIDRLKSRVSGAVHQGQSIREIHGRDESACKPALPDAVFLPESAEDAARAISLCAELGVPVVPFGTGSGQEGGVLAVQGGLSIDTSALNRILEINAEDMDCLVEAGVTRLQLDRELRATGLFFPVDPGADASIGGMVATGASGTTTPLYGSMSDNVMGLEVVLADGSIIQTGGRAPKSSSGYDLTHLFVASEGTLGLVTKIRLKLRPQPETRIALKAHFDRLPDAVEVVTNLRSYGMPVARAELMNATLMRGVALLQHEAPPDRHLLCLEFHGEDASANSLVSIATQVMQDFNGHDIEAVTRPEDLSKIWRIRHAASEAEKALRPGAEVIVTDICVPVSRLARIIDMAEGELAKANLLAPLSGHLGDGNFHYALLVDPTDPKESARARAFKDWLAKAALDMGGTISGEHGIGLGKRHLMAAAHGPALSAMRAIKHALDPGNIFNPGKVFPSHD